MKSTKTLPTIYCESCSKRPTCNKLCAPVKKHVKKDWVYPERHSYLPGPSLIEIANNALFTWQDLIASDKPPPIYDYLTLQQNQIIKLRCGKKTCSEIARDLSGGRNGNSIRTNDVRAALKTIKRKIQRYDPLVRSILKERRKQPTPAYPTIRVTPSKKLPKKVEKKISKIDRRHGTDLRRSYNNRVNGRGYDFSYQTKRIYHSRQVTRWKRSIRENVYRGLADNGFKYLKKYRFGLYYSNLDLLCELSQEFWKRPSARLFDSYLPEEKRYKITARVDYEFQSRDQNRRSIKPLFADTESSEETKAI